MIDYQFSLFLGKEKEENKTVYLVERNFFAVLKIGKGFTKEDGKRFLQEVYQLIIQEKEIKLVRLDEIVSEVIQKTNFSLQPSLAIGYLDGEILYLKTMGEGVVYIKRGKKSGKIIEGIKNASGYIKKDDYLIFSFNDFFQKIGDQKLKEIIDQKSPLEVVERLSFYFTESDNGLTALFVKFFQLREDEDKDLIDNKLTANWQKVKENFFSFSTFSLKKKLAGLAILLIVLFFGYRLLTGLIKLNLDSKKQKIETTRQSIEKKLNEAEDTAFYNIKKSIELINEAKNELNQLEKELDGKSEKEIVAIKNLIGQKEKEILKKEEKKAEEFFDLAITEKNATGSRFYLNNNQLLILDNKNGRVYQLNLEKKSIDTFSHSKIKLASLVAGYEDKIFFFVQKEGIFQIGENNQLKKLIDFDKDWGEVIDFWVYNGNFYLLDKKNDEVYKYLVTGDGYSGKNSYFKSGEAVNLEQANSMAIDSSIYLGFSDYLLKYTTGIKDDFNISFPTTNIYIKKIYTDKNLELLFVWDKKNASIYLFSKKGEYQQTIKSSFLSQANDFVVYNKKIFFLLGGKIFAIDL